MITRAETRSLYRFRSFNPHFSYPIAQLLKPINTILQLPLRLLLLTQYCMINVLTGKLSFFFSCKFLISLLKICKRCDYQFLVMILMVSIGQRLFINLLAGKLLYFFSSKVLNLLLKICKHQIYQL